MTVMPWDRFEDQTPQVVPEVVVPDPEPELPYIPPTPNVPEPQHVDFGKVIADAFKESLEQAAPILQQQAMDYARQSLEATLRGQQIDHTAPSVTATTARGEELVIADAKNRSWRTFVQGLAIDVVIALIALAGTLTHVEGLNQLGWITIAALVVKTLIQAAMAYVMRIRISPTVKTDTGVRVPTTVRVQPLAGFR